MSGLILASDFMDGNLEVKSFPVDYDVDLAVVPLLVGAISDASSRRISQLPGTTRYSRKFVESVPMRSWDPQMH
jgi:hypothetical protein